jgi:hypothetical protein
MDRELTQNDPEFLPVQYDLTEAKLNQLAVDYDPDLIPHAEAIGDEGYEIVHSKVMSIIKVRTNIDKVRKTLKKDALDWGRKVDGEAKRLTKIVEDLETPWRKVKFDIEEAESMRQEEERIAEMEKLQEIEGKIADMRELTSDLINGDTALIQNRMNKLTMTEVTEEVFGDYLEAATVTKQIVGEQLNEAFKARKQFEDNQKAMEAQQAELKQQQEALEAGRKELEKAQSAMKASEDAAKATELAEDQRKADIKSELERKAAASEAAKQDVAKMENRLPQDLALRAFADALDRVEIPVSIIDHDLIVVLDDALDHLSNAIDGIRSNTQEVK